MQVDGNIFERIEERSAQWYGYVIRKAIEPISNKFLNSEVEEKEEERNLQNLDA